MLLISGAYVVYILENQAKKATITDMFSGLYWGLITVTSVGYGDMSPVTWGGKFVTGIYGLVGCAFFALPAGILGTGFGIQVAKQKSQQYIIKIRNPAALLIQTSWRTYTTKRDKARFHATWDNLLPLITGNVHWPGYYSCLPGIKAICNTKQFHAFGVDTNKDMKAVAQWIDEETGNQKTPFVSGETPIAPTPTTRRRGRSKLGSSSASTSSGHRRSKRDTQMRRDETKLAKYKAVIQFIMRIKYWTCIRRFRKERYPFVELTDIHEKNALWHLETISCLREMRETTTNLREQLDFMKVVINERIVKPDDSEEQKGKKPTVDTVKDDVTREWPSRGNVDGGDSTATFGDPPNREIIAMERIIK